MMNAALCPSAPLRPLRALILGGTREARDFAQRVALEPRMEAILSLAGRTGAPLPQGLPTRIGGFGGVDGLIRYLVENRIDRVVDATHPFAARISANARAACAALGLPLAALSRPPWSRQPGDRWIEVEDNDAAARALGTAPRRVFLTIGRQGTAAFRAAPQHDYLIRAIEEPQPGELPPNAHLILSRGPFTQDDEIALMQERRIEVVVSKNSGGPLTYAKIEAARALALAVVMVTQPLAEGAPLLTDLDAGLAFLREGLAAR